VTNSNLENNRVNDYTCKEEKNTLLTGGEKARSPASQNQLEPNNIQRKLASEINEEKLQGSEMESKIKTLTHPGASPESYLRSRVTLPTQKEPKFQRNIIEDLQFKALFPDHCLRDIQPGPMQNIFQTILRLENYHKSTAMELVPPKLKKEAKYLLKQTIVGTGSAWVGEHSHLPKICSMINRMIGVDNADDFTGYFFDNLLLAELKACIEDVLNLFTDNVPHICDWLAYRLASALKVILRSLELYPFDKNEYWRGFDGEHRFSQEFYGKEG